MQSHQSLHCLQTLSAEANIKSHWIDMRIMASVTFLFTEECKVPKSTEMIHIRRETEII